MTARNNEEKKGRKEIKGEERQKKGRERKRKKREREKERQGEKEKSFPFGLFFRSEWSFPRPSFPLDNCKIDEK